MRTTPITKDSLIDDGFVFIKDTEPTKRIGDRYEKKENSLYTISYSLDNHRVDMVYREKNAISMPCYTWEQMRFYENIIGISDALCLRHPNKYCLVVDKCVLTEFQGKFDWTELSAFSDEHFIVFNTMSWFYEELKCDAIIRKAIRERGIFLDYNTLKSNL